MIRMTGLDPCMTHFKTLKYAHHHCRETAQTAYMTHTKNACDDKVEREEFKERCAEARARWSDFVKCLGTIHPFFAVNQELRKKVGGA
jgi:hypothetical protein